MKVVLLFLAFLASASVVEAQASPKNNPVKWEILTGKNKEFVIFMPAGYQSAGRPEYYLGRPDRGATRISTHNTIYRYINGVVLMMEYYEGKTKDIQNDLIEREKLTDVASQTFGDFTVKHFSKVKDKQTIKIDHFALKDRLYVVRSCADSETDPISVAFFQSVRLTIASGGIAPNAPAGSKETSLPNIYENIAAGDDSQIFSSKDVDRDAIMIYSPRPFFTFQQRQGLGEVSIKLRLLLSSTGKVTDVEVLSSSSKLLERPAIETAKKTVFIPAQKDGRLVATYKITEFNMGVSTTIR